MRRLGAIALIVAAIAATAGVAASGGAGPQLTPVDATLTASGYAAVSYTPDTATLTFGTSVQKVHAATAISANAVETSKLIDELKAAGARDLSTNAVSLSIVNDTSQPSQIVGFVASNAVQASAPVDQVGTLIDRAVAGGATNISGPSFTSTGDEESSYRSALRSAVAQARQRAQVLADAAGVRLVRVVSIDSSGGGSVTAIPTASTVPTPVLAPTQRVTASATIVFAVQPSTQ